MCDINVIDKYLIEIKKRKKNLELRKQIQNAEDAKELTLLTEWESSLELIIRSKNAATREYPIDPLNNHMYTSDCIEAEAKEKMK